MAPTGTDRPTAGSAGNDGAAGLIRLHNDDWGFETNCFVCEPRNERGLQIPFFHDVDGARVVAEFSLDDAFSGAPSFVHGGVTLAILDEAMAWACIAVAHRWAVTVETATTFDRPVFTDTACRVEARIRSMQTRERPDGDREEIAAAAEVLDADGHTCASASATFVSLGEAQVQQIADRTHTDHSAIEREYLAGS